MALAYLLTKEPDTLIVEISVKVEILDWKGTNSKLLTPEIDIREYKKNKLANSAF